MGNNLNNFIPFVLKKNYIKQKFDPNKIHDSLLKETGISEENARKVTDNVVRFLISTNLKLTTAPLIREVANIQLLKLGLEKERLEYTRIGLPKYDLDELYAKNIDGIKDKLILGHIDKEYNDVNILIKQKDQNNI